MSSEKNKQMVSNFWEFFSGGNYTKALSIMADTATWWVAGKTSLSGIYSKTEFSDLLANVSGQAPKGIKVTPKSMTAEENRVSMEADSYAEISNGKIYENEYHFLFTIEKNQIVSVKEYLDTEHVTQIFG